MHVPDFFYRNKRLTIVVYHRSEELFTFLHNKKQPRLASSEFCDHPDEDARTGMLKHWIVYATQFRL